MKKQVEKYYVDGDKTTLVYSFKPIKKYTKSDHDGKRLMCPICEGQHTVHKFNWKHLTCPHCQSKIKKYDWLIEQ